MSSTVVETLEPVVTANVFFVIADDSVRVIDSGRDDVGIVHVENNRSNGRAVHQNSSEFRVKSDVGPVIVAGNELCCSADVGDSAIGPANQAASQAAGAGTSIANYCAEIVNSERLEEYRTSIGELDRCFLGERR